MQELMKNIPWDKLGEMAVITIVSIVVIYFVFKKYIDHKDNELEVKIKEVDNKASIELQKVKQDVAQIEKNVLKDSEIDVIEGSQVKENELDNSSIKVH